MPDFKNLIRISFWKGIWDWFRAEALGKLIAGIALTAILALLAYLCDLLTVPHRLTTLQSSVTSLQKDVGSLQTARESLEKSSQQAAKDIAQFQANNKEFSERVQELKVATAKLEGTVKTVDNLTTEVAKLRDTSQTLNTSVTLLSENTKRLAAQQSQPREINHVALLSKANNVEFGNSVAEFRVPFADAGIKDIRSARVEFINCPPDWNDISLECLWDGSNSRFRVIARGDLAPMKRNIDNGASQQLRLTFVSF